MHLSYAAILIFIPLSSSVYPKKCEDAEKDCDFGEICLENECLCDITQYLQYDEVSNRCVKLAGAICDYSSSSISSEAEDSYQYSGESSDESCVAHAVCDEVSGTCICEPDYETTSYGECKKSFGTSCDNGELCNDSAFLNCDKKTKMCRCAYPSTMVFDPRMKYCVSKLNEECEFQKWMGIQKECVENAECRHYEHENSEYTGRCECKLGFTNTSTGTCKKIVGGQCAENDSCITGYCISGKCGCGPDHFFDHGPQRCLPSPKVGNYCDDDGDTKNVANICPSNAICNNLNKICECEFPFMETSNRTCARGETSTTTTHVPNVNANTNTVTNTVDRRSSISQLIIVIFVANCILVIVQSQT